MTRITPVLLGSALALGPSCTPDDIVHGQDGTDTSTGSESSATVGSLSVGSASLTGASSTTSPQSTTTATTDETLDGTTDATSSSTSDTTDASSSSTGVPTNCGNGELDDGEDCDDHNTIDGDGCNADCMPGGQEIWTFTIDGGYQQGDIAYAVATDDDDDVYVAGSLGRTMPTTSQGFLVKLDDDGQLQWTASYGDGPNNFGIFYGVAVLADQSVVVTGVHHSDTGNGQGFVRCYSEDGDELWTYFEPDIADSAGFALAVDSFGDVVVVGNGHDPMSGAIREWVAKLTPDGDVVWSQRVALPYDAVSLTVALDSNDAIFLAGFNAPAVLMKLDTDGNELWTYDDVAAPVMSYAAATASDDGIFVAGNSTGGVYFAHHPSDGVEPDWTDSWIGNYGGSATAVGLAVDSTDRTIWVGIEVSLASAGYPFARKLDTDHSVAWTHEPMRLPGANDVINAVAVDSLDQPVVVGRARDDDGDDDLWVRKLTQ